MPKGRIIDSGRATAEMKVAANLLNNHTTNTASNHCKAWSWNSEFFLHRVTMNASVNSISGLAICNSANALHLA
jgi:hypothetical protein